MVNVCPSTIVPGFSLPETISNFITEELRKCQEFEENEYKQFVFFFIFAWKIMEFVQLWPCSYILK